MAALLVSSALLPCLSLVASTDEPRKDRVLEAIVLAPVRQGEIESSSSRPAVRGPCRQTQAGGPELRSSLSPSSWS
jgi:hypothetical protein